MNLKLTTLELAMISSLFAIMSSVGVPVALDVFDFVGAVKTVECVQANINRRYDDLFVVDPWNKTLKPYVCSVCDEFILHWDQLDWLFFDMLKTNQECLNWDSVLQARPERCPLAERSFEFRDPPRRVLKGLNT